MFPNLYLFSAPGCGGSGSAFCQPRVGVTTTPLCSPPQHYFTVNFNHENQKSLELRTEDAKDCDEWVAAIAHARCALCPWWGGLGGQDELDTASRPSRTFLPLSLVLGTLMLSVQVFPCPHRLSHVSWHCLARPGARGMPHSP